MDKKEALTAGGQDGRKTGWHSPGHSSIMTFRKLAESARFTRHTSGGQEGYLESIGRDAVKDFVYE